MQYDQDIQRLLKREASGEELSDKEKSTLATYRENSRQKDSSRTKTDRVELFGISLKSDFSGQVMDTRRNLKTPPNEALQDTKSPEQLMKAHRADFSPIAALNTNAVSINHQLNGLDVGQAIASLDPKEGAKQAGQSKATIDELEDKKRRSIRLFVESTSSGNSDLANKASDVYQRLDTSAQRLKQQLRDAA